LGISAACRTINYLCYLALWKEYDAEEDSQSGGWTTSLSGLQGLSIGDAVKMTQDRDVWRGFVFGLNGP